MTGSEQTLAPERRDRYDAEFWDENGEPHRDHVWRLWRLWVWKRNRLHWSEWSIHRGMFAYFYIDAGRWTFGILNRRGA